jgi:hypothetical protein
MDHYIFERVNEFAFYSFYAVLLYVVDKTDYFLAYRFYFFNHFCCKICNFLGDVWNQVRKGTKNWNFVILWRFRFFFSYFSLTQLFTNVHILLRFLLGNRLLFLLHTYSHFLHPLPLESLFRFSHIWHIRHLFQTLSEIIFPLFGLGLDLILNTRSCTETATSENSKS